VSFRDSEQHFNSEDDYIILAIMPVILGAITSAFQTPPLKDQMGLAGGADFGSVGCDYIG
jgi:hypothetical protein